MSVVDIANIDLSPYQTTPMLPAEATLTLALDLGAGTPPDPPSHVDKARKRMLSSADEVQQVLIVRIDMAGVDRRLRMAYDTVSDRFWAAVRQRCFYWMAYDHEGLDLLDENEQELIKLPDKRQKAELARELDKHLFGTDGLKFLSKPFNQQVALMASRLKFIAGSDKFSAYQEIIGADLLNTLTVLQGRYEAMVRERANRDDDNANIRDLRHKLQRHISLYATAVLSMLDEDDPDSVETVLNALRPIANARVRKSSGKREAEDQSEPASEGLALPNEPFEGLPEPAAEIEEAE